jgi:hypothetical protein
MKSIMARLWSAVVEASTSTLSKPDSQPVEAGVPARTPDLPASLTPHSGFWRRLRALLPDSQPGEAGVAARTPELSAEGRFFKRQRFARIAMLVGLLMGLGSIFAAQARLPALAPWSPWLDLAGSGVLVAACIWCWRCTLCGGGLKFNGRTCSKCGHEFSRAARATRSA